MKTHGLGKLYRSVDIKTTHQKRDAGNNVVGEVEFDLMKNESSSGTQKFIALSSPILRTLEEGSIFVVDELDARLHPRLTHGDPRSLPQPGESEKCEACMRHA